MQIPWESGSSASVRAECLRALLPELTRGNRTRLVILDSMREVDHRRDQRIIGELRAKAMIPREVVARHSDDAREVLLCVPDTVGWAVHRHLIPGPRWPAARCLRRPLTSGNVSRRFSWSGVVLRWSVYPACNCDPSPRELSVPNESVAP